MSTKAARFVLGVKSRSSREVICVSQRGADHSRPSLYPIPAGPSPFRTMRRREAIPARTLGRSRGPLEDGNDVFPTIWIEWMPVKRDTMAAGDVVRSTRWSESRETRGDVAEGGTVDREILRVRVFSLPAGVEAANVAEESGSRGSGNFHLLHVAEEGEEGERLLQDCSARALLGPEVEGADEVGPMTENPGAKYVLAHHQRRASPRDRSARDTSTSTPRYPFLASWSEGYLAEPPSAPCRGCPAHRQDGRSSP